MDSVLRLRGELGDSVDVGRRENYVASTRADTTGHGTDVLECIAYFAPDARFETYRTIATDRQAKRGNLVAAIADASEGDTDLLNLSVGVHHGEHEHGDCGGQCRVAEETRLAIQSGTTVVAATGNRERNSPLATHCPALLGDVVGVGGFVARCTTDLVETTPAGQYWVRSDDEVHGPYCGQQGCDRSTNCVDNRFEQPWQGNVSFHNAAPDALAPVHHPAGTADEPILQAGTSFGTGVVTGVLASILGDAAPADRPAATETARMVRAATTPVDRGALGKFDAEQTRRLCTGESTSEP